MEQTIEYKGYIIQIVQDTDPLNPRTDWDSAGHMTCMHRRYNLGDKHDYRSDDYSNWQELKEQIEQDNDVAVILPVYMYDHSGITISTSPFSCSWDSGQIGYIYMTKEIMEKEKWTKEQAEKYLEGEVEVYDQYLTGDVWGYQVLDEDENIIESCYGYYGDTGIEDAIQEGKSHIDYRCKKEQEEYEKQPKKKAAELHTV